MITYVNGLLSAWGRWANRDADGGTGWPRASMMFRDVPSSQEFGSKLPLGVGNQSSECEVTDKAVHRLKAQEQRLFDLAVEFYKRGGTGQEIAARLGIGKRTMYDRLDVLHQKVLGHLNDIGAGC